jgi:hypothetical protein
MPDDRNEPRSGAQPARQRLTPADRSKELLPWRVAPDLSRCKLYWLPVRSFPVPGAQRDWLLGFLDRWAAALKTKHGLRAELFLQYKTVHPELSKPLLNHMLDLIPILGLGRKPGAGLPQFPSNEEIRTMTKSMFDTLKREEPFKFPNVEKYMPDYAYWFVEKSAKAQLDLFFGHGGITMAFLKPDPKTVPAPLPISEAQRKKMPMFQIINPDKTQAQAASLADGFLAKSKQLFGAGLESEPQMKGIPFILPLLDSPDFFSQPPEVVENAFQVFEVYLRESPLDKGMLLAFKSEEMEETLIGLLRELREENAVYPEA